MSSATRLTRPQAVCRSMLVVLLLLITAGAWAVKFTPPTRIVPQSYAPQANSDSSAPTLSADGRYVVFESAASNLVAGDTNGVADIFRYDVQTGGVIRVSVGAGGAQANGASEAPTLSADGRYVAFSSRASNLVAGDTNGAVDIFRYDVQTGGVIRVSVGAGGAQANSASDAPALSADGRYLVFHSRASNLVAGDTNNAADIFRYDGQTGEVIQVSVGAGGAQANSSSYQPTLNADGRYVAFFSYAANLVAGDTNNTADIFRYDGQTGEVIRVSVGAGGAQANGASDAPALSADGRYLAFRSWASNLVAGDTNGTYDLFRYDGQTGEVIRVNVGAGGAQANGSSSAPALSADGRYVVFHSYASNLVAGDTNGTYDLFLRDCQTGEVTRVNVGAGGTQANGYSAAPALSADGRYVAFESSASNLVAGDTNGVADIFRYDCQTGEVIRVNVGAGGTQANGYSYAPTLSADGRYLAFESSASNLVAGDTNGVADIFITTLAPTPALTVTAASGMAGEQITLQASLTVDGQGLAGQTVAFAVDGAPVGTATTGATGVATLDYTIAVTAGPHTLDAIFTETDWYDGAQDTGTLTVTNLTPVLTTLAPAERYARTGAFTLAVTGENFYPNSVVRWNGADRPTTFVSATRLEAAIAAADIQDVGTAQVTVYTPLGGGTLPLTFTITDHLPVAVARVNGKTGDTVEQATAAGTAVALRGTDSTDPADDITTYAWDLDGDNTFETTGATVTPTFPLGTHTATLRVTDRLGHQATATVQVQVQDTTPPTFAPPSNLTVVQTRVAGTPLADIALVAPAVTDICDAAPTVTHNAPALFPLGTTTVTWTATDASGQQAQITQTVTVVAAGSTLQVADATGPANGAVTLQATLRDSAGKPRYGYGVAFTVGGVSAGTALTNTYGVATLNYAIGARVAGPATIRAQFAGAGSLPGCVGEGTLTVVAGRPTSLHFAPAPDIAITADETVAYTVQASDGVNSWDVTKDALFGISANALGRFAVDGAVVRYTPAAAGAWTVYVRYQGLYLETPLTVSHGAATALTLAPATAAVDAGTAQTYTCTAADHAGNTWAVTNAVTWQETCAEADVIGSSLTPTAAGTVTVQAMLDGVASNAGTLTVRPAGMPYAGCTLAFDWNGGTPQYKLGDTAIIASGEYPCGTGTAQIALTRTSTRLMATLTGYKAAGETEFTPVSGVALDCRWVKNSKSPQGLYSLTQISTVGGLTQTASYYASFAQTLVGADWKTGCWLLTQALVSTTTILPGCRSAGL